MSLQRKPILAAFMFQTNAAPKRSGETKLKHLNLECCVRPSFESTLFTTEANFMGSKSQSLMTKRGGNLILAFHNFNHFFVILSVIFNS